MVIYTRFSRAWPILMASLVAGVGMVVVALIGRVLLANAPVEARAWTQLGLLALLVIVSVMLAGACLHIVYAISVERDGTVEFQRVLGSIRVDARDIVRLEGIYTRDYEGDLSWDIRIQFVGGSFRFGEFPNVVAFVDQVKAHNPDVEITGLWPMNIPPVRPSMWHV